MRSAATAPRSPRRRATSAIDLDAPIALGRHRRARRPSCTSSRARATTSPATSSSSTRSTSAPAGSASSDDHHRRDHRAPDRARPRRRARGRPSAARARRRRPWRATLGLEPSHRLTGLYAEALNQLGAWLATAHRAPRRQRRRRSPRASRDAVLRRPRLLQARPDHRQRPAARAAWRTSPDIDRLTIFADNLVPHVLRLDGVLATATSCAAIDAARAAAGGEFEREVRACAVHACEALAARRRPPAHARQLALEPRPAPPYSTPRAHHGPCSTGHGRVRRLVGELEYPMFIVTAPGPLGCLVGFTTQAASTRRASSPASRTRTAPSATARRARSASTRCPPTPRISRSSSAARPRTRSTSSRAHWREGPRACRSSTAARTGSSAASRPLDAGDHDAFLLEPIAGESGEGEFTFHRAKRIDPGTRPDLAVVRLTAVTCRTRA